MMDVVKPYISAILTHFSGTKTAQEPHEWDTPLSRKLYSPATCSHTNLDTNNQGQIKISSTRSRLCVH